MSFGVQSTCLSSFAMGIRIAGLVARPQKDSETKALYRLRYQSLVNFLQFLAWERRCHALEMI